MYDPLYIGGRLSPTVDIAFKLSKARTVAFLLTTGLIVFVWQQFLALLTGGAFHKLMAGTQHWPWTGVIIFFAVPASLWAYSTAKMTILGVAVSIRMSMFKRLSRKPTFSKDDLERPVAMSTVVMSEG